MRVGDTYLDYLRSDEWAARKLDYRLSGRPTTCYCCGSSGPVEFHHRSYKRVRAERPSDLITVCRSCHQDIHRLHRDEGFGLRKAAIELRRRNGVKGDGWERLQQKMRRRAISVARRHAAAKRS